MGLLCQPTAASSGSWRLAPCLHVCAPVAQPSWAGLKNKQRNKCSCECFKKSFSSEPVSRYQGITLSMSLLRRHERHSTEAKSVLHFVVGIGMPSPVSQKPSMPPGGSLLIRCADFRHQHLRFKNARARASSSTRAIATAWGSKEQVIEPIQRVIQATDLSISILI